MTMRILCVPRTRSIGERLSVRPSEAAIAVSPKNCWHRLTDVELPLELSAPLVPVTARAIPRSMSVQAFSPPA
jgi:hypothetical protein